MPEKFDVIVIGSGTAGQSAAHALSGKGFKVALVESTDRPGGVCALAGCQAKKWFYEATELVARSRHLNGKGVIAAAVADWGDILKEKNKFTSDVPDNAVNGLYEAGIDYIQGVAHFLDPHTLAVDGQPLAADFIVIAVGATPMPLPIEGAEHMVESDAFLELSQLPRRIVFVGGGFISFEFAHFVTRLDAEKVQCTILEASDRPLGPFDAEMVALLSGLSAEEGIEILCNVEITAIGKDSGEFHVTTASGKIFKADLVVHGAGRSANLGPLELEKAGIDYTPRGISVSREMVTTNPKVYAVGDCAATPQLARVADFEALVAVANIAARKNHLAQRERIDYRAVPAVLFTYPQYAMVGVTESALQQQGVTYRKSFAKNLNWPTYRRVGLKGAAYKILIDQKGRILGAHILSDNATGLIQAFSLAMTNGINIADLRRQCIMTPYPSRESDIIYMLGPLVD